MNMGAGNKFLVKSIKTEAVQTNVINNNKLPGVRN